MANEEGFDVKKLVDQSGQRLSVDELKSKGFERINVLDKNTFNKLIQEAVERIISTRTNLLSDREKQKIFEASRNELKLLMAEHDQLKKQSDLIHRDKGDLAKEIENLQRQLQLARKIAAEEAQVRYEAGMDSQQPLISELKRQVEALEKENSELREKASQATSSPAVAQMLEDLTTKLEGQFQQRIELLEGEKRRLQDQAASAQAAASSQSVAQMMEQLSAKLENKMQQIETSVSSQQQKIIEEMELRKRLEEESKKDERVGQNLEKLMARMTESLGKKLKSIASGKDDSDVEYRPGQATLDQMFKQELESNLENIDTKSVEGKDAGSALDKLKAMRNRNKPD